MTLLGGEFVEAVAARDSERLAGLLHPEIDFRGLTPNRLWEARTPAEVLEVVFANWFEPADRLDEIVTRASEPFADRERLRYALRGRNDDGPFIVEQQAYIRERDGQIGWMRLVCSGFCPLG